MEEWRGNPGGDKNQRNDSHYYYPFVWTCLQYDAPFQATEIPAIDLMSWACGQPAVSTLKSS